MRPPIFAHEHREKRLRTSELLIFWFDPLAPLGQCSTGGGVVDLVVLVEVVVQTQVADVDADEGVVELGVKGVDVALQT